MLKYLIIMLAEDSVSFCHYEKVSGPGRFISSEVLSEAIFMAMKENLSVQFVYPERPVPEELLSIIDTIDHVDIKPSSVVRGRPGYNPAVIVSDGFENIGYDMTQTYILRTSVKDIISNIDRLILILEKVARLNIVLTDLEMLSKETVGQYGKVLEVIAGKMANLYEKGHKPQLNILTDRLMLSAMNNCNAGLESITLAANGIFYPCPAFINDGNFACGTLEEGISVRNSQLYDISKAPVCRQCDAWHCKRCVWLNRRLTREINIPGWQQCVTAHYERNASRKFLQLLRGHDANSMNGIEIPEISYLDPFIKIDKL